MTVYPASLERDKDEYETRHRIGSPSRLPEWDFRGPLFFRSFTSPSSMAPMDISTMTSHPKQFLQIEGKQETDDSSPEYFLVEEF